MSHHLPSRLYSLVLLFFFLVVTLLSGWLLFQASGLRILKDPVRIVKTGLISLRVHPRTDDLVVRLNGEVMPLGRFEFLNLAPGRYEIVVEYAGYHSWRNTTEIKPDEAKSFQTVVLFKTIPEQLTVPSEDRLTYETILGHPERFQEGLQTIGGEIWAGDQLVTRFSQPVTQVLWFPDQAHVLALVDGVIHVLDRDGSNDVLLYQPEDHELIRFAPIAGGDQLVVETSQGMELLTITAPYSRVPLPSF